MDYFHSHTKTWPKEIFANVHLRRSHLKETSMRKNIYMFRAHHVSYCFDMIVDLSKTSSDISGIKLEMRFRILRPSNDYSNDETHLVYIHMHARTHTHTHTYTNACIFTQCSSQFTSWRTNFPTISSTDFRQIFLITMISTILVRMRLNRKCSAKPRKTKRIGVKMHMQDGWWSN